MLGVFKRRWKQKRSTNVSRIPEANTTSIDIETNKHLRTSVHQIHPICEEETNFLGYDKHVKSECSPTLRGSPPPYLKRASLDSKPNRAQCYPLAPNICVEAGKIQFVRNVTEDAQQFPDSLATDPSTMRICGRVTVTREQQTDMDCEFLDETQKSSMDRIHELEVALEQMQKRELREKKTITKLLKQLARKESAQRDADRERRLRAESESRTNQVLQEAALCKAKLILLTTEFTKLEDILRSMLVHNEQAEQSLQETNTLKLTFEHRCQRYHAIIKHLNDEIATLRELLSQDGIKKNPEEILHLHAAALHRHAEESRKQYERCLDDVAKQVVRALVAQKVLREEIGLLNERISELECQNRSLLSMLAHKTKKKNLLGTAVTGTPDSDTLTPTIIIKHCNSLDSEGFDGTPGKRHDGYEEASPQFKRRMLTHVEILDKKLSVEDKKRHHILTKLWSELKGTEVTPQKLLETFNVVDSNFWVPPQRPVSLDLHLPVVGATNDRKPKPILEHSSSKSKEKITDNESPESVNRDEGYSTMSSDIQTDLTRASGEVFLNRGLEDLKEVTDETDIMEPHLVLKDNNDSDVIYIPFNLMNLKPRNSFPPTKDILPFRHIIRSFSDSHLCIKITSTPTPCFSFSSPVSSSPSFFLLNLTDCNPLRRAKATNALWENANLELFEDRISQISWSSAGEECHECTTWGTEHIQQWLRLDESRLAVQQQHGDMLELEYDRAEFEDWSLSLSMDDLGEQFKRLDEITPGQVSTCTLPSIREKNALELEADSKECLWNTFNYMTNKENKELMILLMDNEDDQAWPYACSSINQQVSPDCSWSSGSEAETYSKRSSVALSGNSDDTGDLPAVGTDFTRDFYRLVKFESTKSLASPSSRSIVGPVSENGDQGDSTFHSVLSFITEQHKYVTCAEQKDAVAKETNIDSPLPHVQDSKVCDGNVSTTNELANLNVTKEFKDIKHNIVHATEICLATRLDVETENCCNISELRVIGTSVSPEKPSARHNLSITNDYESVTSSVSTSKKVVSKIPRRKQNVSKIPRILRKVNQETKIPKSNLSHSAVQYSRVTIEKQDQLFSVEGFPHSAGNIASNITPQRSLSLNERSSIKDVIYELSRIIKRKHEHVATNEEQDKTVNSTLDQACVTAAWVHVEEDIDLTDHKTRANLLDAMVTAESNESSSSTSSCGGSVASDSPERPQDYGHLHRIHRLHRVKKANAVHPDLVVVKASMTSLRPTIIDRPDFFVRYGEKEMEAVASFDFLDNFSMTSSSLCFPAEKIGEAEEEFKIYKKNFPGSQS